MKRMLKTTVAALTLGLASLTPSFAKADDHGRADNHRDAGRGQVEVRHEEVRHDVRDVRVARPEVRVEHDVRIVHDDRRPVIVERPAPIYVAPAITDFAVSIGDVPVGVMNTLNYETRGGIESVTLVRNDGPDYYQFTVRDGRSNLDIRIGCDGHFISLNHC